ncbi:hypothetical protein LP087_13680 (plasmid) [Moraxella bovis]|uniref:hypothetical protein n=1 Tax=Moraxella bovis TaxID=476 RepID=UPI0022270A84|nr:hypothetical protein [Moraxella bovis]UZA34046.1 hypothetical protein LP087_13680 [Moraxella bovis]UZA49963.1 hypothetical protein LP100_14080 [Moraxella bovis]
MKNFTITHLDLSSPNLQPLANDVGMDENEVLVILQSVQGKKHSKQFDENEMLVFEKLLTMSRKCNIYFTVSDDKG